MVETFRARTMVAPAKEPTWVGVIIGVISVYMQYMVYKCVYYCDT
jgi:DMSO reductase anchor subunit